MSTQIPIRVHKTCPIIIIIVDLGFPVVATSQGLKHPVYARCSWFHISMTFFPRLIDFPGYYICGWIGRFPWVLKIAIGSPSATLSAFSAPIGARIGASSARSSPSHGSFSNLSRMHIIELDISFFSFLSSFRIKNPEAIINIQ